MHIDDELIRKFFDRKCSEEEAKLVADWLRNHPHLAEQYYKESDWINESGTELPEPGWDSMWEELSKRTQKRIRARRLVCGLAASVCVLIFCIRLLISDRASVGRLAGLSSEAHVDSVVIKNDSDTSFDRRLADGTLVKLLPHSVLRFSRPQWDTSREVQVEGEIVFHVAKDQRRPFVAYCSNLSIQALGTVFSVKGGRGDKEVNVRLYEGKVVVKPFSHNRRKIEHHFARFLIPGQELTVPLSTYLPKVRYFLKREDRAVAVEKGKRGDVLVVKPTGWYEFTNQSLVDVFTTLEVLYGVHIHYNRATVENLFFIGRFEPEDSIEYVLNTIAVLNDLKITKGSNNNYYIVRKG